MSAGGRRIEVLAGDITQLEVDAIVNAANTHLLPGGGVCGVIHKAGGQQIFDECMAIRNRQGGCPAGGAVLTTGGKLKARFVIHAVGPVWQGGSHQEEQLLQQAYGSALKVAKENGVVSIAFPNISTGIYGFPKERAAAIAIKTVVDFLAQNALPERVVFCCFDEENLRRYEELLKEQPATRK